MQSSERVCYRFGMFPALDFFSMQISAIVSECCVSSCGSAASYDLPVKKVRSKGRPRVIVGLRASPPPGDRMQAADKRDGGRFLISHLQDSLFEAIQSGQSALICQVASRKPLHVAH